MSLGHCHQPKAVPTLGSAPPELAHLGWGSLQDPAPTDIQSTPEQSSLKIFLAGHESLWG